MRTGFSSKKGTETTSAVAAILVLVSVLVTLYGLASLTKATEGAGVIAIACFLGIMARIAQARAHQEQLLRMMRERG